MASTHNPKFRVYEDTLSNIRNTNIDTLAELKVAGEPDIIHPAIVQLFQRWGSAGTGSSQFPLMLSTMGKGNIKYVKSPDLSVKARVMGRPRRGSRVISYTAGANPGQGKIPFKICFADRWFERDWDLMSPSGETHVKVIEEPVRNPDGTFTYTVRVLGSNPAKYVPTADLAAGKMWGSLGARVGLTGSDGNAFKGQAWSEVRNQAQHMRWTYTHEGNVENKAMVIEAIIEGKKYMAYTELEKWQFELKKFEDVENNLWWSQYNRDNEGLIHDRDINSDSITPHMSGLDEQVTNSQTFSTLTTKVLKDTIRNVFYNAQQDSDNGSADITLYTGTLGAELFSDALRDELTSLGLQATSDKFVSGSGRNLEYGAYFSVYRHQDGHTIRIAKNPIFDNGVRALTSDPHPLYPNMSLTSADMYFVDNSTYNGKPNLQFLAEEGRIAYEKAVLGVNNIKGYSSNIVASSRDASKIEFGRTAGLHVNRPTNCFKLLCNAS